MNVKAAFAQLDSERKIILSASFGNDIVRCFFSDLIVQEKELMQGLDTSCPAEEFKQKYKARQEALRSLEDFISLIDQLKKQHGEVR